MATDADDDEGWGGGLQKARSTQQVHREGERRWLPLQLGFLWKMGRECERRPNQGAQQQMHREDIGGWKWEREGEGGRTGKGAPTQNELLLVLLGLLGLAASKKD